MKKRNLILLMVATVLVLSLLIAVPIARAQICMPGNHGNLGCSWEEPRQPDPTTTPTPTATVGYIPTRPVITATPDIRSNEPYPCTKWGCIK